MDDLLMAIQDAAESMISGIGQFAGGLASQIPAAGVALLILMVSLFFFLVDGQRVVDTIYKTKALSIRETRFLMDTTAALSRAVILAMLVVAVVQAGIYS